MLESYDTKVALRSNIKVDDYSHLKKFFFQEIKIVKTF